MPKHGPITCNECKSFMSHIGTNTYGVYSCDVLSTTGGELVLENNPLSFGASNPDVLILGFSKGGNQNNKLETSQACTNTKILDDKKFRTIAFHTHQPKIEIILKEIGLISEHETFAELLDPIESLFQFGSVIKCSLYIPDPDPKLKPKHDYSRKKIMNASTDAKKIMNNCINKHHSDIKDHALIIHFGTDKDYLEIIESINIFDDGINKYGEAKYATIDKTTWLFIDHPTYLRIPKNMNYFIENKAKDYRYIIKNHYQNGINDICEKIDAYSHETGQGEKFSAKLSFNEDEWRIEIANAISLDSDENGGSEFDYLSSLEGVSCPTPLMAFNNFKFSVNQYLEELNMST